MMAPPTIKPPEGPIALIIEYTDPLEGFKGWLVRDTHQHRLCAGGVRVQAGLTRNHLCEMARNMTRKMQIANLQVDGAKCGIDYDPLLPGKQQALGRFMAALLPYIKDCYSMGPDLNVDMQELDNIGKKLGIPSVKMAVASAMGWNIDYFLERYAILHQPIDGWSLNELRAGAGVAQACLSVCNFLNIPPLQAKVVIQGFGAVAKACAYFLNNAGASIIGIADYQKSIIAREGSALNIAELLLERSTLLPRVSSITAQYDKPEAVYGTACDIFIPAAVENSVNRGTAPLLLTKAVVPGANLAVSPEGEEILKGRDILVMPDYLAGCGGSLSMEGLFGPASHPEPKTVLHHVQTKMAALVEKVLAKSLAQNVTPAIAALHYCSETVLPPGNKPYAGE